MCTSLPQTDKPLRSLITSYIERKFSLPHGKLGSIISVTLIVGIIPVICSSAISKRFGLIKTMVGTHLPSAVFLALTPFPASLGWTVFFLAARSCIGTMDQAPCSVFLTLIFPPDELTRALGVLNIAKMLSNSIGPVITGALMNARKSWIAFVVAGALKVAYDLGLLIFFMGVQVHEAVDGGDSTG